MEIFYSNRIIGDVITLSEEESRHCIKVLRHRKGDGVTACAGDGNFYRCEITDDNPAKAVLRITETVSGVGGHDYYLRMAVAPTKNIDRFEWFLEKATEMGVDAVTPLLCDRSERKVFKRDRGERVIVSAVKQSLKTVVPELDGITPFDDFINRCKGFDGEKFIAFCDGDVFGNDEIFKKRVNLSDAVKMSANRGGGTGGGNGIDENSSVKNGSSGIGRDGINENSGGSGGGNNTGSGGGKSCRAVCAIGPEGDFSPEEVRKALDNGFIPLSLGESRLRTETAALLCVAAYYIENSMKNSK